MTYREKLVAVLKANGHVLREVDSTFTLPFGSEYSVLIKNLDSKRIQVKVSIDAIDATEGTHLIVAPNSSLELERFIKGGNLNAGNRFKFIERSDAVEAHRGIHIDDGLVRIEAWTELVQPIVNVPIVQYHYTHTTIPWYPFPYPYERRRWPRGPICRSMAATGPNTTSGTAFIGNVQTSDTTRSADNVVNVMYNSSLNDAGITVAGSESHQQFTPTLGFALEAQSRVIVLKLRGEVGGVRVTEPITVKYRPQCVTCGKTGDPMSRFCAQCGTALAII